MSLRRAQARTAINNCERVYLTLWLTTTATSSSSSSSYMYVADNEAASCQQSVAVASLVIMTMSTWTD